MSEAVTIGRATLYLGRCEDVLPMLPDDIALISDPPYGQRHKTNVIEGGDADKVRSLAPGQRYATAGRRTGRCKVKSATVWPATIAGDEKPFDPAHLLRFKTVLLWGAHKFGHALPRGRWLGWDKVPTGKIRDQGDGELAWTNVDPAAPLRLYRMLWDGVCVGSQARHEVTAGNPRVHPTQKPESVILAIVDGRRMAETALAGSGRSPTSRNRSCGFGAKPDQRGARRADARRP
jgi:site-specific DNA-methyltransferase (adenine-specific)